MGNSQERKDEARPAGASPGEQPQGGRSGEGAASAMEQLISQRQRDDGQRQDERETG